MTGDDLTVIGSGRTDAGVHAWNQVAHFHCDTRLDPEDFLQGLNSLLAKDIVIKRCQEVDTKFHARYDVKSKVYRYYMLNNPVPSALLRRYAWFIKRPLDTEAMKSAFPCLIGQHDFKAFEGRKKTMIVYQNKDGYIMSIESFKRLNKGRSLSKSQIGLLGLKKIKINKKGEKK